MATQQLDLGFGGDDWARRLERELALKLMPLLDRSFSQERCREVSADLAKLAARRARDAGVLSEVVGEAKCVGCGAVAGAEEKARLCRRCVENVFTVS